MKFMSLVMFLSTASTSALPRPRLDAELIMPNVVDQEARELKGLYLTRLQRQKHFENFDPLNRPPQRVQFPVPLEPGGIRLEGQLAPA